MNKHVFFNHDWVDYDSRAGFLLESDLAVLASGRDLETRLSFRTRLLDSLWAGIPMVLTRGDHFSELVEEKSLGRVVEPRNHQAMAQAILELLESPERTGPLPRPYPKTGGRDDLVKSGGALGEFCAAPRRHPGADHSRLGPYLSAARYYWQVFKLLARYGGFREHLGRRLKSRGG